MSNCPICGAPKEDSGRFCEKCRNYYCHWVYRIKKEREELIEND